jgi:hypothetical protein
VQSGSDRGHNIPSLPRTPNRTLRQRAEPDPKPDRTWGAVRCGSGPNPNPDRTMASLYYAEAPTAQRYHPVIFDRERCCWVELRWSTRDPTDHYWITVRPASDDLNCNIPNSERLPVDQQGPEDDHDPTIIEQRQNELRAIRRLQSAIIQSPTVGIA